MADLITELRVWAEDDVRAIGREAHLFDAADADKWAGLMEQAADRLTLYETAIRTLQEGIAGYTHAKRRVSAEELIDLLISTVDGKELVRALNAGQRPPGQ